MASTDPIVGTRDRLDDVAWQFLSSEFAGEIYQDWSIEQRLDAFLRHRGHEAFRDDGSAYEALLDRVMANIGAAIRAGVLPQVSPGKVS
ncbi:hypothetical protein JDV09_08485 [Mycobacterium sp. Y57]|uniref:hypothetical protein n=1 Tax=Mycolicibacterium xanthum TaxID=2796469 RepID=UPI001C84EAD6|nr:hypothetical protein [Mycolicibacterium xanthum]MBX7432143.1 hypothetical protein [Mycolicibacterium xanthum]